MKNVSVAVIPNLDVADTFAIPAEETEFHATLLNRADISDPLNQLLVCGLRVGKFGARVTVDTTEFPNSAEGYRTATTVAISQILQIVFDHHGEIAAAIANAEAKRLE